MGVDVVLVRVNRKGSSARRWEYVEQEAIIDVGDLLADLLEANLGGGGTPLLDRIDLTSDLTVTADDAVQLVEELQRLESMITSPAERERISLVLAMARRLAGSPDLQLQFQGD